MYYDNKGGEKNTTHCNDKEKEITVTKGVVYKVYYDDKERYRNNCN